MSKYHEPVLLNESVDGLNIDSKGVYVDVTFGGGNSDYYGNYTELSFSGCLLG